MPTALSYNGMCAKVHLISDRRSDSGGHVVQPGWAADEHGSHAPPEILGSVTFATSCASAVSGDFERAVALLHSFAYDAAEKAFKEIVAIDPACAMAHWGVAMSYYHQLWSPPDREALVGGRAELVEAARLGAPSDRERLFIAAAAAYFNDFEHRVQGMRAQDYQHAMGILAGAYPQDVEAQIFYALALVSTAPPDDRAHNNQKHAGAILEPIYREHPDHPGVAHYLIHAYDSAELAPRALAAARAYAKIAPSVPHALHMPSHIFTRLGLWEDSITSNLAARAAAQREGDEGEALHAMDYLAYAYLQRGRDGEAEQVILALGQMGMLTGADFKTGYAATAMPVRLAMERHRWGAARGLQPLPQSAPHVAALVYWARAEASARAGQPQAADKDIARLEACGDSWPRPAFRTGSHR